MLKKPVYELVVINKQDMLEISINKLLGASLIAINLQQILGQSVLWLGS